MAWKDVIYGMTGGIASGKTSVARLLEEQGALVIDADQIAREAVAPGTPALEALVDAFGPEILHPDGTLNRTALGDTVFNNDDARATLNGIVHPEVARRSAFALAAALQTDRRPVIYDAALLVETGRHRDFAGLIVVASSVDAQIRRLMNRDALSEEDARARVASQLPLDEKLAVADFVVDNNGPMETLPQRVEALLQAIREREENSA